MLSTHGCLINDQAPRAVYGVATLSLVRNASTATRQNCFHSRGCHQLSLLRLLTPPARAESMSNQCPTQGSLNPSTSFLRVFVYVCLCARTSAQTRAWLWCVWCVQYVRASMLLYVNNLRAVPVLCQCNNYCDPVSVQPKPQATACTHEASAPAFELGGTAKDGSCACSHTCQSRRSNMPTPPAPTMAPLTALPTQYSRYSPRSRRYTPRS